MATNLLDTSIQTKFVNALAVPTVLDATKGGSYVIGIKEAIQDLGLIGSGGGTLRTTVWGYGVESINGTAVATPTYSYPGPTIVAQSNVAIKVNWHNNLLPLTGYPDTLPLDLSLNVANADYANGAVPTTTHLHGGHTDAAFDGFPTAVFTQGQYSGDYTYGNTQQGATLWYHDHAMGVTRLNVYMGTAGFYLLRDSNIDKLMGNSPGKANGTARKATVLPDAQHEFGLAIQDRAFTVDGQLYRPGSAADDPLPGTGETVGEAFPAGEQPRVYPFATPEFFGDFLLVNGKAWPKTDVDRTTYTYHLLNGSDSRFYSLRLDNANVKMTLVGSDGGLLPNAITVDNGDGTWTADEQIVLAPGDRVDVVMDFSKLAAGDKVTLQNFGTAWTPFKGLNADGSTNLDDAVSAQGTSVGEIMQFQVTANAAAPLATVQGGSFSAGAVTGGTLLNAGYTDLTKTVTTATPVRKLGLFEMETGDGHIMPMIGTAEDTTDINGRPVKAGSRGFADTITEDPLLGSTEVWEVYNNTADAHPVHLHQVQFQVIGKYTIADSDLNGDGYLNDAGTAVALRPEDLGNQDTVWVAPNEMLKIVQKFDLPGEYVWHCHILSHEDNEMMRPLYSVNTVTGTKNKDKLDGTADIDAITAGLGNDTVFALAGDDRIIASLGDGNDAYDGGLGSDTYDLSGIGSAVTVDLGLGTASATIGTAIGTDTLVSVENVLAGAGDDTIIGSAGVNFLAGGAGNDVVDGGVGADTLWGGLGDDALTGGADADVFLYYREVGASSIAFGNDVIRGFQAGIDRLEFDNRIFRSFDVNPDTGAPDPNSILAHATNITIGGATAVQISFIDPTSSATSSVTLEGVTKESLSASSFAFV